MKEIIFWFSSHKVRNYWLGYAINDLKEQGVPNFRYSKIESWIQFGRLKISFKVNINGDKDLMGLYDKNQYWVEDLFDNNFRPFFYGFIFDNKPFEGDEADG